MSTIITRNSATSGSSPSSLVQGELAINVTDGKLFYGSGSGNIVKEFGTTASYALQALSSSYATTASYVQNAQSASYVLQAVSASYATTASYAQNAQTSSYVLSASYSQTASYLNTLNQDLTFNGNLTLNGTASITFLNVVYESASVIYSSGSNQFGDASNDVQTLWGTVDVKTGPVLVTGSLNVSGGITGSLLGTASYAIQALSASYASIASHALTASYVNPLNQTVEITGSLQVQNSIDSSTRFLIDSSGTSSLDWEDGYLYNGGGSISVDWRDRKLYDSNVDNSVNWNSRQLFKSDGTTVTLNWETGAFTGSMLGTASYAIQALSSSFATTASYVQTSQTASYVLSASYASTASYVQNAQTASYVLQAISASYATTASYVQNAQSASYVLNAISASYATTASYVQNAQSASYVLQAVSASYAATASYYGGSVTSASFATTASYVNSLRQTVQVTGSLNVTGSVYINNALYSNQTNTLATENKILYSAPTSTYDALFVEYVAKNGSNVRAGQIMSSTDGTSVKYTETTTTDLGSTTPLTFNVSVAGGNIRLEASASTSTWTVKTITRTI